MNSALEIRITKRLTDFSIEDWDFVTSQSPVFLKKAFLVALEESMPATLLPRYMLLYNRGKPVAAVVGQILTLSAERIFSIDEAPPELIRSAIANLKMRVVLWGNFLGWGVSGIAFAPGAEKKVLWPQVAEAISNAGSLEEDLKSAQLHLVLDIPLDEMNEARALEQFQFRQMQAEPDMILELNPNWKSFKDYRGALKSKYRKAANRMDKELADSGCIVRRLADVKNHADKLTALHLQVHEQSSHRFVTLSENFISSLSQHLGERFICNVVSREKEILGFMTTIIDEETAFAYVVGHNVKANKDLPIYLRLLQTAVEEGIKHGCKRVTFGRTALEPKSRVGAIAVPLLIYGRHKSPLLGPVITRFIQIMAPKDGPPPRNPFKSCGDREEN